jgi:hypothetical protein
MELTKTAILWMMYAVLVATRQVILAAVLAKPRSALVIHSAVSIRGMVFAPFKLLLNQLAPIAFAVATTTTWMVSPTAMEIAMTGMKM